MINIILVSGGLDSYLGYKLYGGKPVFVDYGQKYAWKEKNACDKLYDNYDVIKIEAPNKAVELDNNYIPVRNLHLLTNVVTLYHPDQIIICGMKDDNCSDKTEKAFLEYSHILSKYSKKKINVISPFWGTTKGEAIEKYIKMGHNVDKLKQTISCYNEGYERCCDCEACFRWYVSLESNGINTGMILSERIKREYIDSINKYDEDRKGRILRTCNMNIYERNRLYEIQTKH